MEGESSEVSIMPAGDPVAFEATSTSVSFENAAPEILLVNLVITLSNVFDKMAFATRIMAFKDISVQLTTFSMVLSTVILQSGSNLTACIINNKRISILCLQW